MPKIVTSCKSNQNFYLADEDRSVLSGNDESKYIEAVLNTKQGAKCSTQGIFNCMKNQKLGALCYSQCSVSSKYFCNEASLNSCIEGEGGSNACHAKYCEGGGDGEFMSLALLKERKVNPNALAKFPKPRAGGIGYQFYDPDSMKYGTNRTIVRVQELAKRLFRKTGNILYIGDLSNRNGGNSGRHAGHIGGKEVDFAVIGNSPKNKVYDYRDSPHYDRHATRVLFKEMLSMGGGRKIFFNDSVLIKEFSGFVFYARKHYDHIHVFWDAD